MQQWLNSIMRITPPLAEANWEFRLVSPVISPLLVSWMGYLSATKQARHLITCTKLTGWKDQQLAGFKPDKFASETTHDFLAVYQKVHWQNQQVQLFRFQIHNNDSVAKEITKTLATAMINCPELYSRYVLEPRYDYLWQDIAEVKLKTLDSQHPTIWRN